MLLNCPELPERTEVDCTEQDSACTFITSCYSTRLSWALVLAKASPVVQDKNRGLEDENNKVLATTFALKEQIQVPYCFKFHNLSALYNI